MSIPMCACHELVKTCKNIDSSLTGCRAAYPVLDELSARKQSPSHNLALWPYGEPARNVCRNRCQLMRSVIFALCVARVSSDVNVVSFPRCKLRVIRARTGSAISFRECAGDFFRRRRTPVYLARAWCAYICAYIKDRRKTLGLGSSIVTVIQPAGSIEESARPCVAQCGLCLGVPFPSPKCVRSRPTINSDGLLQSHRQRLRELGESVRDRNALNVVRHRSHTMRPCLNRTTFTPWELLSSPQLRKSSIRKMRKPANVRNASRTHFSTRCGGAIAKAVDGLPRLWTWIAPSEIGVLPLSHSAITIAVRVRCQRLASPMMAMVCAGKCVRGRPSIRGQTVKPHRRIGALDTPAECDLPTSPHDTHIVGGGICEREQRDKRTKGKKDGCASLLRQNAG